MKFEGLKEFDDDYRSKEGEFILILLITLIYTY